MDGLIFGGAYLWREICISKSTGLALKLVTVLALFYFAFESNFPSTSPRGAYIWRGDLTEGFCVTSLGGLYLEALIHGGAYFRNFTIFKLTSIQNACIS